MSVCVPDSRLVPLLFVVQPAHARVLMRTAVYPPVLHLNALAIVHARAEPRQDDTLRVWIGPCVFVVGVRGGSTFTAGVFIVG